MGNIILLLLLLTLVSTSMAWPFHTTVQRRGVNCGQWILNRGAGGCLKCTTSGAVGPAYPGYIWVCFLGVLPIFYTG
jgi:hypothetical protein